MLKLVSIWSGDDDMCLELAFAAVSTMLDASDLLLALLAVCFFAVCGLCAYACTATSLQQSFVVLPFKLQKSHFWSYYKLYEMTRAMSDVPVPVWSPFLWEFVYFAKNTSLILVLFKLSSNMRDGRGTCIHWVGIKLEPWSEVHHLFSSRWM